MFSSTWIFRKPELAANATLQALSDMPVFRPGEANAFINTGRHIGTNPTQAG